MQIKNRSQLLKTLYYLIIGCSLVPLAFYCYVFIRYSTNAPYYDDFYWGISFLDDYIHASSIAEKLRLIFQQHAQHRIAYFRLFMVGYYHLFGEINFKYLIIIGNISNLVIFYIFYILLKKEGLKRIFILPVSLILFQLQYYQNIISTYGFPNQAVLMWAILAFYTLTLTNKKAVYFTILFAILSVFSNGNGILTFPIILFFLFIQRRFKDLKITAIIFALFIIVYFATFERMSSEITFGFNIIIYFIQFLKSAFYTNHNTIETIAVVTIFALFMGKFLFDCYALFFKKREIKYFSLWVFSSAAILWIFATAGSVAVYRAIRHSTIPNWYMNYSVLLIIFSSIFLIIHIRNNYLKGLLFLLLVTYGIKNYIKNIVMILPTIQVFQSNLNADTINFKRNSNWSFLLTQVGYPLFEKFNTVSNAFYTNGLYVPLKVNEGFLAEPNPELMNKGILKVEHKSNGETYVYFDMLKKLPIKHNLKDRFGFIMSEDKMYYFGVVNPIHESFSEVVKNKSLFEESSFFIIPPQFFERAIIKGDYKIGMVFLDKTDQLHWYLSDEKVKITNY